MISGFNIQQAYQQIYDRHQTCSAPLPNANSTGTIFPHLFCFLIHSTFVLCTPVINFNNAFNGKWNVIHASLEI